MRRGGVTSTLFPPDRVMPVVWIVWRVVARGCLSLEEHWQVSNDPFHYKEDNLTDHLYLLGSLSCYCYTSARLTRQFSVFNKQPFCHCSSVLRPAYCRLRCCICAGALAFFKRRKHSFLTTVFNHASLRIPHISEKYFSVFRRCVAVVPRSFLSLPLPEFVYRKPNAP